MDETSVQETNWLAIGLGAVALIGFVASFYIKPQRVDFEWIMAKHTLRWEAPVFAAFMFALSYNPSETVIYGGFVVCFIAAAIGTWIAYREGKELERQGKLATTDGKE